MGQVARSTKIEALAAEMGVTVADVEGFVVGLSVWVNKGYSLVDAIRKHSEQMARFVNHGAELVRSQDARNAIAGSFWDASQVSA